MVWVVFLVRWVGFFGGFFKVFGFLWWLHFLARDWNLHVINSHVAGAIGWSFMRLDAAWHEWILVALAVVIDGMLAVSAQCGCCHHFLPYFSIMPYHQVCFLWLHFFYWSSSCLLYVLWIYSSYNIFALCILLHGVYIVGIMGFVWWGSYSAVYVPPPLCLFPVVLIMCIPPFFSVLFCMLISSFTYPPIFAFSSFVCVLSMLG